MAGLRKAKDSSQNDARARRVRRQRIFNRVVLVGTLVIIIIVTAYAFSRPQGLVLPSYLNRCVPVRAKLAYSSDFIVQILVNGQNVTIPSGIGIVGSCIRPIHTFSSSGTVHIDTDENRTYTLKDFFLLWGITYGEKYATFNSNQLLLQHGPTVLRVGNQTDSRFENLPLPTSGNAQANPIITVSCDGC